MLDVLKYPLKVSVAKFLLKSLKEVGILLEERIMKTRLYIFYPLKPHF